MSSRTLLSIHEQRLAEHERGMCKTNEGLYRSAINLFSRSLGHEATIDDLTPANFNKFVDETRERCSLATAKGYSARLKTIWLFAYDEELVGRPRKLRKIQSEPSVPVALTHDQVARLVQTSLGYDRAFRSYPQSVFNFIGDRLKLRKSLATIAEELNESGRRTSQSKKFSETTVQRLVNYMTGKTEMRGPWHGFGLAANLYLPSIISAAWDTGLRLGDMFAFKVSDLIRQPSGGATFDIVMNKTGYMVAGYMQPSTMELIDKLLADSEKPRELIWPCPNREAFYRIMHVLVEDAGVVDRSFKHIRSGSASAAENIRFGAGTELLGHRNRSITVRHYLDPRIVKREAIILPSVVPAALKPSVSA
jgi:hypothetical protein